MDDYTIDRPHKSPRKIVGLIVTFVMVAALVLVALFWTKLYQAQSTDSYPVKFEIKSGRSASQIAHDLSMQNLIGSEIVFRIYSQLTRAGFKIQAGEYTLNRNMSIAEIMDVITHGHVIPSSRSITIIEGWTNDQIGKFLTQQQIVASSADFQKILKSQDATVLFAEFQDLAMKFSYQGFLYPDTYLIGKDEDAAELVVKMLQNFDTKFTTQMLKDRSVQTRELGDILILASIIEKEVGRNQSTLTDQDLAAMQEEREWVASVFYNRLAIGMGLESDATVNYVTGKADRSVTIADTKIKSPYNTYQVKGLPPTPISNPGIGSISAAMYPAQSDYLYFLNAPNGTAYFAKTLAEHNANKAKYLK